MIATYEFINGPIQPGPFNHAAHMVAATIAAPSFP